MSYFEKALKMVLKHEGGWVNDPNDRGGETYKGIARAFHAGWLGWLMLDRIPNKKRNDIFKVLEPQVASFYYKEFWRKFRIDEINDSRVAKLVFDFRINSGKAIKIIQKVLNDNFNKKLAEDNIIGINTLRAINSVDAVNLLNAITDARIAYFKIGVKQGWLHSSFLNGLVRRAETFYVGKQQLA